MNPYEVQLNINCVDGMLEAIQGSGLDIDRVWDFLWERDHEWAHINMNVRDTPDSPLRILHGEAVYAELRKWLVLAAEAG